MNWVEGENRTNIPPPQSVKSHQPLQTLRHSNFQTPTMRTIRVCESGCRFFKESTFPKRAMSLYPYADQARLGQGLCKAEIFAYRKIFIMHQMPFVSQAAILCIEVFATIKVAWILLLLCRPLIPQSFKVYLTSQRDFQNLSVLPAIESHNKAQAIALHILHNVSVRIT
jgi:hypothetical protein